MRSMRFWLHLGNRMLRMAAQFPAGNVKATVSAGAKVT